MSRAIKPKRDDTHLTKWESVQERAPSIMREDTPTTARILAMVGLFFLVLGILAMLAPRWQRATVISPGVGFFIASIGMALLLFHAFSERDLQFRRIYGIIGLVLALVGILLPLGAFRIDFTSSESNYYYRYLVGIPALITGLFLLVAVVRHETERPFRRICLAIVGLVLALVGILLALGAFRIDFPKMRIGFTTSESYRNYIYLGGIPALVLGLFLLIAVVRHESERQFRRICLATVGIVGLILITYSVICGLSNQNYMPGEGALLMVLGLLYACSYIGLEEVGNDRSYYAALTLGGIGVAAFVLALIRSLWTESNFLVPSGLILMGMSLVYLTIALGICVDWPIVVLTRRELAAYFYSPIAYLVFIGLLLVGWFMFWQFVEKINEFGAQGVMFEPIIGHYIFDIFPVIALTFVVPALTMRLISEERRSGTLEVLMTAPVNEISVVLGKFFASWIFYMLLWIPWMLFLVALRYMGGEEFDYRPVLSFTVAMAAISAGFLSMGLFFSTITNNQIIAAVLTFVGMIAHLAFYFMKFRVTQGSALFEMLGYINYLDFWYNSLDGILAPRYLVFHLSVAVFFLFVSIKVLESRKWQ